MSDEINNQPENSQADDELSESELDQIAGGVTPAPGTQQILIGLLLPAVQTQVPGDGSVKPAGFNFGK